MAYRTAPDTSCAYEIGEHLVGKDVTLTLRRGQIIDVTQAASGEYLVSWTMPFTATSPEDAARQALNVHRDPTSLALQFDVVGPDGREHVVDLLVEP